MAENEYGDPQAAASVWCGKKPLLFLGRFGTFAVLAGSGFALGGGLLPTDGASQHSARAEHGTLRRRDADLFFRADVHARACGTFTHLKSTESGQCDLIASLERTADDGKGGIDDLIGLNARDARFLGDGCDKFALLHLMPPWRRATACIAVFCVLYAKACGALEAPGHSLNLLTFSHLIFYESVIFYNQKTPSGNCQQRVRCQTTRRFVNL